MGSLDELIRDLRRFEQRRVVTNALAKELRKPVPGVRKAIRARARKVLPTSGGFGVWVSKLSVTARVKLQGRAAGVRLVGRRKGFPDDQPKADLRRIDQGTARHPSWGRRGAKDWHLQKVTPGFFSDPATEVDQWREAALRAVDEALEVIRRG
ncbi:hypothetical protein [Micromonospora endolithica]|uniref:Uncharacterized protein n=1 Tax=Micromonospora endolithica TaxID=230091 RepID=A0A3A9YR53_9ACTN|nr:hypothetical protein [Micromonospora endolithica]RKN38450.1 hypothetical protein D7223_31080 [Micromonospora endolithica]TWJ23130.1 hypothetical protein JD76_03259 [Micromonospora endolithica]